MFLPILIFLEPYGSPWGQQPTFVPNRVSYTVSASPNDMGRFYFDPQRVPATTEFLHGNSIPGADAGLGQRWSDGSSRCR